MGAPSGATSDDAAPGSAASPTATRGDRTTSPVSRNGSARLQIDLPPLSLADASSAAAAEAVPSGGGERDATSGGSDVAAGPAVARQVDPGSGASGDDSVLPTLLLAAVAIGLAAALVVVRRRSGV